MAFLFFIAFFMAFIALGAGSAAAFLFFIAFFMAFMAFIALGAGSAAAFLFHGLGCGLRCCLPLLHRLLHGFHGLHCLRCGLRCCLPLSWPWVRAPLLPSSSSSPSSWLSWPSLP